MQRVNDTLQNFDRITHTYADSGHHVSPDTSEDFRLVLKVLQEENIFTPQAGRQHSTFRNVNCDPFVNVKAERSTQMAAATQAASWYRTSLVTKSILELSIIFVDTNNFHFLSFTMYTTNHDRNQSQTSTITSNISCE